MHKAFRGFYERKRVRLTTYIENRYQEVNLEMHNKPEYNLWQDSETKALHQVLGTCRTFMKWIHFFLFPFGFFAVLFGLKPAPRPVLTEMARQQKALEEAAKAEKEQEKMAASLGMQQKKKKN